MSLFFHIHGMVIFSRSWLTSIHDRHQATNRDIHSEKIYLPGRTQLDCQDHFFEQKQRGAVWACGFVGLYADNQTALLGTGTVPL
jgi:hypothetical protein